MAAARSHPSDPERPLPMSLRPPLGQQAPIKAWGDRPLGREGPKGSYRWGGVTWLGGTGRSAIPRAALGLWLAGLTVLACPPQALALPSTGAKPGDQPAANRAPTGLDGGYGHWQSGTRSCKRNLASAPQGPCQLVQLDQQVEGLLTVRFIAPGAQKDSLNQLIVVGLLQPNSQPLLCQQGRCQPAGPLTTAVSTVSERSFDGRGLAQGLPKAWLANGNCRFDPGSVRCEATAPGGERWQADASF